MNIDKNYVEQLEDEMKTPPDGYHLKQAGSGVLTDSGLTLSIIYFT